MPALEEMDLVDDAVLWEKVPSTVRVPQAANYPQADSLGQVIVLPPEPIMVKWEEEASEYLNSVSAIVRYNAVAKVDRYIEIGSVIWLGKYEDLPVNGNWEDESRNWEDISTNWEDTPLFGTSSPGDLYEVKDYYKTKDIKGNFAEHWIGLMRYKDALPTICTSLNLPAYITWDTEGRRWEEIDTNWENTP